ncbi:hypothetical protein J7W08_08250 [Methanococcoides orientis]|uniref:hypothetical protein n=1 Tax=Methanococcoides orientis TaxID=2822137 RepID=UPI001E528594|nr:hypothetical protein [Methanococcoides orientis]UGV40091.1 hypothetical protein J7W08_08250 [Methanococcoides orientis]
MCLTTDGGTTQTDILWHVSPVGICLGCDIGLPLDVVMHHLKCCMMDLYVFLRDWHLCTACMKHFAGFHFETFNVGMTAFIAFGCELSVLWSVSFDLGVT